MLKDKIAWHDPEDAEFFGGCTVLLDEKYLYSNYHVYEERQAKWEIQYEENTQAKRIVEFQKTGKIEGHRGFGYFTQEELAEARKQEAKEIPADWIEMQKNRDKEKELLINLSARRTWGLLD